MAVAALLVACTASACSTPSDSSTGEGPVARSVVQRDTTPVVAPADAELLRKGNTAFATDLYQTLRSDSGAQGENIFFSPHSISTAIAMTYAGARANTEKEIASTLHFDLPQDRLHPALDALDLALESRGKNQQGKDGEPFRLHSTNSLWGAPDMPFVPTFLDTIAKNYGAGVRLTDFVKDPEAARQQINRWVEKETEDRIKELLKQGVISPATRLVLVNAIYFNAAWQRPFSPERTTKATFHGAAGDTPVDMMRTEHSFRYAETENYKAVGVPYAGSELSFVAVLPMDLSSFESKLGTYVDEISSSFGGARGESLGNAEVDLALPKFKIEGESFSLKSALKAQGMKDAFEPGVANLTGMANADLYISDVVHKAFIDVDEHGTEAAAATAAVGDTTSAPEKIYSVTFDRPFVFFIRDDATGAILFLGRVAKP